MIAKLSGHSQDSNFERVLPLIQRLRDASPGESVVYWKTINPSADAARRCAEMGVQLIARFSDLDQVRDAGAFVNYCIHHPAFPYITFIETPNEPGDIDRPEYVAFESAVVEGLRQYGKEVIVNNVSTGRDGHYVPGAIWYSGHEYGWPNILDGAPFHALRYRTWFPEILKQQPNAKLFFTEMGVTQAVLGGPDEGWRSDGRSPEEFINNSLRPFMQELNKDPYVLAAFLFQMGSNDDWFSHDALGEVDDYLIETHTVPSLREEENRMAPSYKFGFEAKVEEMKALGIDPGEPLEDETYFDAEGNVSLQPCEHAALLYLKQGNKCYLLLDAEFLAKFFRRAG